MLYNLYGGIMIKIEKYKNLIDKDGIKITTEEGAFSISFEGKSGLYWRYTPPKEKTSFNKNMHEFYITKENYFLYNLIDKLFIAIKEEMPYLNCSYDVINRYMKYRPFGDEPVFIFDKIEWHSDDSSYDKANVLSIFKYDEDTYKIEFMKNKGNNSSNFDVRFRTNGSRYWPFNLVFFNMYNDLLEYNRDYHQVHYEEYLYNEKVFKKTK